MRKLNCVIFPMHTHSVSTCVRHELQYICTICTLTYAALRLFHIGFLYLLLPPFFGPCILYIYIATCYMYTYIYGTYIHCVVAIASYSYGFNLLLPIQFSHPRKKSLLALLYFLFLSLFPPLLRYTHLVLSVFLLSIYSL